MDDAIDAGSRGKPRFWQHARVVDPEQVLEFWFADLGDTSDLDAPHPKKDLWFEKSDEVDREIHTTFGDAIAAAIAGRLGAWTITPRGNLAHVILIDQFCRNCFRGEPRAFEHDPSALRLSLMAEARGDEDQLSILESQFLFLPLMHSEDAQIHREHAQPRFEHLVERSRRDAPAQEGYFENVLRFQHRHREIIERFGRYPHRNATLGRESTPEEVAFLNEPNSSF